MSSTTEPPFRTRLIDHILWLKNKDPDYARQALKSYHEAMPWLDLMQGIKDALRQTSGQ